MDNKVEYELDGSTRYQMSMQKQGVRNPNYGRPRDEETKRKISDSQRKRHAKIKAFSEATQMASIKRVWGKIRWQGFIQYNLLCCNESLALYSACELTNQANTTTYRVYYIHNDIMSYRDFEDNESATQFYQTNSNPDVEILCNETKTKVIVLAILK